MIPGTYFHMGGCQGGMIVWERSIQVTIVTTTNRGYKGATMIIW